MAMAYKKYKRENAFFAIHFTDIFGGGWEHDIMTIIVRELYPEKIERKLYKAGWHSSDSEIYFAKNSMEAIVHLDDFDSICIYTKDIGCSEEQLETWAQIIDRETEKINKKNHS